MDQSLYHRTLFLKTARYGDSDLLIPEPCCLKHTDCHGFEDSVGYAEFQVSLNYEVRFCLKFLFFLIENIKKLFF